MLERLRVHNIVRKCNQLIVALEGQSFPNRQEEEYYLQYCRDNDRANNTLKDNFMLQIPKPSVIDLDLTLRDHELIEESHQSGDTWAVVAFSSF